MHPLIKSTFHSFFSNNAFVQHWILRVQVHRVSFKRYANSLERKRNGKLKNVKAKLSKKERVKVVFLVTDNTKWNVDSVYWAFEESKLYEPIVLVLPKELQRVTLAEKKATQEVNFNFFNARGMYVQRGMHDNGSYVHFDELDPTVVFFEQPHKKVPNHLWIDNLNKETLACYVPYGIMTAKVQQIQFNKLFHHNCDIIFAESDLHKSLFRKYSVIGDDNVVVSGHPKLDSYSGGPSKNTAFDWPIKNSEPENVKRIIWAPHSSIKNRAVAFSTFHKFYKQFLLLAKVDSRFQWVVKPHPWLRQACDDYGLMTLEQYDSYMAEWDALPNAKVYDQGNYFELFKTADAMILDSVSFISEFMASKKPLLFLVNRDPPLVGFNEYGDRLLEGPYKGKYWEEVLEFLEQVVLQEQDYKKNDRLKLVNEILTPMGNNAGEAIRSHLSQKLGIG